MPNADAVRVVMADHLEMLVELVAIGVELDALERLDREYDADHHQTTIEDVRRRQQRLCLDLLEQLRALLLACEVPTVH